MPPISSRLAEVVILEEAFVYASIEDTKQLLPNPRTG
jgi:hypothetical protein